MEKFSVISPVSELLPYIKQFWILEGTYSDGFRERIIPAGSIQLCFYQGINRLFSSEGTKGILLPSSIISGQTTGFSDIIPIGKIRIIAVVFQPEGARAFFKLPMNELAHLKVTADDLSDPQLKELEKRIEETEDNDSCIRLINRFFIERLILLRDHQRMQAAIQLITHRKGHVRMEDLADKVCLSYKQFQRLFTAHIGINPKDFLRTVRFQYALSVAQNDPQISLSQWAYASGFYDQSHMIHEFRHFSGYTPKEFLDICPPVSDYFS